MNENNILTLQDLTKWNQEGVTDLVVRVTDLKKEALKRFKFYKKIKEGFSNADLLDDMKAIEYNRLDARMEEIKEFFNLNGEELI